MAYNNNRRGGGGNFTPKPRPVLPPEHALNPQAEAAIKDKSDLRDFARKGGNASNETTVLNSDPSRSSIPVAQACIMAMTQCGIPADHTDFPQLKKFDTRYDANHYHIVYTGPINWVHDHSFRHIPCFTRYVMDKYGRILNAVNGLEIVSENQWMVELVPDGPSNTLSRIPRKDLFNLAFAPLPEGFTDFGFRTYSHEYKLDVETGKSDWIPKPAIKVKNNATGSVDVFPCLSMMVKCLVGEFDLMREFNPYTRNGLKGETVTLGDFTFKEAGENVAPGPLPVIEGLAPTAKTEEPAFGETNNDFDNDIVF